MTGSATKASIWAERIQQWELSGLSQRVFCERKAFKYTTFDYWRRQLSGSATEGKQSLKPVAAPLKLVPLQVSGERHDHAIVLRSPAGWELCLPSSVEPIWLAAILRSLP